MSARLFYRIVVPTDFSACADAALDLARRLAAASDAELVLVHVLSDAALWSEGLMSAEHVDQVFTAVRQRAEAELERRRDEAQRAGVRARAVTRHGSAWREIVDVVTDERADLAVMGTHGRGGLDRTLLGSVADRVVRMAPCPILTVREPRP